MFCSSLRLCRSALARGTTDRGQGCSAPNGYGMLSIARPISITGLGAFTLAGEGVGQQSERGRWLYICRSAVWEDIVEWGPCVDQASTWTVAGLAQGMDTGVPTYVPIDVRTLVLNAVVLATRRFRSGRVGVPVVQSSSQRSETVRLGRNLRCLGPTPFRTLDDSP